MENISSIVGQNKERVNREKRKPQAKYQVSNNSRASAYSWVVGEPEITGKYTANNSRQIKVKTTKNSVYTEHSIPPGKAIRRVKGPLWEIR